MTTNDYRTTDSLGPVGLHPISKAVGKIWKEESADPMTEAQSITGWTI